MPLVENTTRVRRLDPPHDRLRSQDTCSFYLHEYARADDGLSQLSCTVSALFIMETTAPRYEVSVTLSLEAYCYFDDYEG